MRSGFGVWFFALEIDYEEEHKKTRTCLEKIIKGIKKKKKKKKKDIHLIYFVLMYLVIKKAQERYRK